LESRNIKDAQQISEIGVAGCREEKRRESVGWTRAERSFSIFLSRWLFPGLEFLSCALFPGCLRRCWRHQAATLLGMQFRRLGGVMNRKLTVPVSQICVMRFLFVLLCPVVFRCLVVMVGRFLMITSGVMIMLPGF